MRVKTKVPRELKKVVHRYFLQNTEQASVMEKELQMGGADVENRRNKVS